MVLWRRGLWTYLFYTRVEQSQGSVCLCRAGSELSEEDELRLFVHSVNILYFTLRKRPLPSSPVRVTTTEASPQDPETTFLR